MDSSTRANARHDRQDNKRAFRWGAVLVAVLIAGAVGYNLVSRERAGPLNPDTPTTQQRPAPAEGGQSGAAGPGSAGGTGTGDTSGTGAPRN